MLQSLLKPGSNRACEGSTSILFDFDTCAIASEPHQIYEAIDTLIVKRNLTLRLPQGLDAWDGVEVGSSASIRLVARSHINGEVYLCDYDQWLAAELVVDLAALLQPMLMSILAIQRGPGVALQVLGGSVLYTCWSSPEKLRAQLSFLREKELQVA